MGKLNDKVAIVTGAGSGIGHSIALALANEGAHIVCVDINEENAKKTAAEVENLGGKTLVIKCDVRSRSDIDDMVKKTTNTFGGIDVLCNNAGVITYTPTGSPLDITEKDWYYNMDVNAKGILLGTIAVAKEMIKRGKGGKIVNTASGAGKMGSVLLVEYCASKAAAISLTQSFALALGQYKINVNSVCPGIVNTPMLKNERKYMLEHNIPDFYPDAIKNTPLGRIEEPEDVAKVVVFLASHDSDFITGVSISVDGGLIMY